MLDMTKNEKEKVIEEYKFLFFKLRTEYNKARKKLVKGINKELDKRGYKLTVDAIGSYPRLMSSISGVREYFRLKEDKLLLKARHNY